MIWYSKWISLGSAETCPIHEGLASQLTGLKGSATTPWCQMSSQVLYPCLDVRVKSSPQWGLHGLNLFKNAPHKLLSEYLFYGVAEDIVQPGSLPSGSDWPWGMYLVSDNLSEGSASQVASRTHNFQAEHFIAAKWSKWFSSLVSGLTVAADWLYSCCLKGRGLCPPAIV